MKRQCKAAQSNDSLTKCECLGNSETAKIRPGTLSNGVKLRELPKRKGRIKTKVREIIKEFQTERKY